MADIFISYARADRDRIEKLAAALEAEGYSVWWDRELTGGEEFATEIERELEIAGLVIAAWSKESANSHWVRDEATAAREQGKLVPIQLDAELPPIGFRQVHAVSFAHSSFSRESSAFEGLLRAIGKYLGEREAAVEPSKKPGSRRREIAVAAAGVVAIGLLITLFILRQPDPEPVAISDDLIAAAIDENQADSSAIDDSGTASIAVLAFENLSDDREQVYFSRGMSEEILNSLAQIESLHVAARNSSFALSDQTLSIREVGDLLNVEHVLQGSVRKHGSKIRITAQLAEAGSGFALWSKTFDRDYGDVFAIQEEIAQDVVQALLPLIVRDDDTPIVRNVALAPDLAAYDSLLRGIEAFRMRRIFVENGAIELFQEALKIDPSLPNARSFLATSNAIAAIMDMTSGTGSRASHYQERAVENAEAALREDDENGLAYTALGAVLFQQGRFVESEQLYRRAIAAKKNRDVTSPLFYSVLLRSAGLYDEAKTVLKTALAGDPVSPELHRAMSEAAFESGDYSLSAYHGRAALQFGSTIGYDLFAVAVALTEGSAEGIALYEDAFRKLNGLAPSEPVDSGFILILRSRDEPALRSQAVEILLSAPSNFQPIGLRLLGESESADQVLVNRAESGSMKRSPLSLLAIWMPEASDFRRSSQFRDVAEHWGLPAFWRERGWPALCQPVGDDDFECN